MQRTAAEQATPHGAPLPELPSELVVSIVRAGKDGVLLVKMLQVCKAWRSRDHRREREPVARGGACAVSAAARRPRGSTAAAVLPLAVPQPAHRGSSLPYSDANQSPTLDAYVLTAELQVHDRATRTGTTALNARATKRSRITRNGWTVWSTSTQDSLLYGRMMLMKEPDYDEVSAAWPTQSSEFGRGRAKFVLYATRLSDLKTARIVESLRSGSTTTTRSPTTASTDTWRMTSRATRAASSLARRTWSGATRCSRAGNEPSSMQRSRRRKCVASNSTSGERPSPRWRDEPIESGTGPYAGEMYMAQKSPERPALARAVVGLVTW